MNIVHRPYSICLICLLAVGCQSMVSPSAKSFSAIEQNSQESVEVLIRPAHGRPIKKQVNLTSTTRLQDVINEVRPPFRKRKAEIIRVSPSTGQRHRLKATFDSSRKISLETDYAVQPGDRILITQDTTSSIESVMQAVLGRS